MPKRTNDFQKLITKIYQQMAAPDEIVTESAIMNESEKGTPREIDILLQKKIFGTIINVAVECRGRSVKDDIEWIDGLIGKYRNLPINKIIAVSKSGFTKGAREKAQSNHIETLTLVEALETDWPGQFMRIGFSKLIRHDRLNSVQVMTDGTFINKSLGRTAALFTEDGELIDTIRPYAISLYEQEKQNFTKEIFNLCSIHFRTLEDFDTYCVLLEIPFTPQSPRFIGDGIERFKISKILLQMTCWFSHEPQKISHYIFGNKQITQATITDHQGKDDFVITVLQESDSPNQANFRIEKLNNLPTNNLKPKKSKKRKNS